MKKEIRGWLFSIVWVCAAGLPGVPAIAADPVAEAPSAGAAASLARISADLEFLSSDEMKGRDTGSPEIRQAAEYIGERFKELGLNTDLYGGTPFQEFVAFRQIQAGAPAENTLSIQIEGADSPVFQFGKNFGPLTVGSTDEVSGGLVFAGYGITAPDANYDDYAEIDAEGKIVIILRGEPRRGREDNPLGGRRDSRFAYFSTKIENAIAHGAAGVLIVNHREAVDAVVKAAERALRVQKESLEEIQSTLESLEADVVESRKQLEESKELAAAQVEALAAELKLAPEGVLGPNQAGRDSKDIPVAAIGRVTLEKLLASAGVSAEQADLSAVENRIADSFVPESFDVAGATAHLKTSIENREVIGINVIGELPGAGDLANETVVIGAHYDHVGMGGQGSLARGTLAVHNGADDNGSGTVTMMEAAHRISHMDLPNRRRIVFMAFSGEEKGLLGSKHYAREPRFPLEDTVGMINLDMVGRLNEIEMLTVFGTGSAKSFDGLVDEWTEKFKLPVRKDPSGYGPSDHTSFYEKDVPVLFFFTGLHSDYHRPSDDFNKINLDGMVRITDMVTEAAVHLATVKQRPEFQTTGPGQGVRRRAAFLGVAMAEQEGQVVITDVVEGGPAEKSGLKSGDTILRIGDSEPKAILKVQQYVRGQKPGAEVPVSVKRGEETMVITVKLGATQR